MKPEVTDFFDPATNTISYIVTDPNSDACAIVDSVMDIDYAAGRISYHHAYVNLVEESIIYPAKALRIALENALLVASTLLLTEATMTESWKRRPRRRGRRRSPDSGRPTGSIN